MVQCLGQERRGFSFQSCIYLMLQFVINRLSMCKKERVKREFVGERLLMLCIGYTRH